MFNVRTLNDVNKKSKQPSSTNTASDADAKSDNTNNTRPSSLLSNYANRLGQGTRVPNGKIPANSRLLTQPVTAVKNQDQTERKAAAQNTDAINQGTDQTTHQINGETLQSDTQQRTQTATLLSTEAPEDMSKMLEKENQDLIKQKKQQRSLLRGAATTLFGMGAALLAYNIFSSGPDPSRPRVPSAKPASACLLRRS